MSGRFRAWIPNATGNLSFSLIGIEGQPSACQSKHFVSGGRRRILAGQRRNLSDNLIARRYSFGVAVHEFDFTLLAQSASNHKDTQGVLRGWIVVHEHCPLDVSYMDSEDIDVRPLKSQIAGTALFAVAFRLYRTGRVEFRTPPKLGLREVRYGNQETLDPSEALRPLVAQCFYFLRDITHRHQHHSSYSDTLTTVWPTSDRSLWIRETLYELYRRVLMLRRQRSPRGQEDALGILAYVAAFEAVIAEPYREEASKDPSLDPIPKYEKSALKESLTANLETKRRARIQRNVVAAVVPAFTAAMLSLSNAIYGRDKDFTLPTDVPGWISSLLQRPMTTAVAALAAYEWTFPIFAVLGFVWIASFAGVVQPSEKSYVRGVAKAAAVWGPIRSALGMGVVALAVLLIIYILLRV